MAVFFVNNNINSIVSELENRLSVLENSIGGMELSSVHANIGNQINALENNVSILRGESNILNEKITSIKDSLLQLHCPAPFTKIPLDRPKLINGALNANQAQEKLQKKLPRAYTVYQSLFENNIKSYEGEPIDSCSVYCHKKADDFHNFIQRYLHGFVLDIGCGPQELPSYLFGYNTNNLFGLDPLPPHTMHPFFFWQGVGEYIPWEDNSFNCIISGTSLDHAFLIDQTLDECRRVLCDGGYMLIWISFDDTAPLYDPYAENVKPYDDFHMFHYRKSVFEDDMAQRFRPVEYFNDYDNSHFYAYTVKK